MPNKFWSISKIWSLHLASNSADPHNSVPCITAIGYNGVRLWEKGMKFLRNGTLFFITVTSNWLWHPYIFIFYFEIFRGICHCRCSCFQSWESMVKSSCSGRLMLAFIIPTEYSSLCLQLLPMQMQMSFWWHSFCIGSNRKTTLFGPYYYLMM